MEENKDDEEITIDFSKIQSVGAPEDGGNAMSPSQWNFAILFLKVC